MKSLLFSTLLPKLSLCRTGSECAAKPIRSNSCYLICVRPAGLRFSAEVSRETARSVPPMAIDSVPCPITFRPFVAEHGSGHPRDRSGVKQARPYCARGLESKLLTPYKPAVFHGASSIAPISRATFLFQGRYGAVKAYIPY
jgi:hypothetical protein